MTQSMITTCLIHLDCITHIFFIFRRTDVFLFQFRLYTKWELSTVSFVKSERHLLVSEKTPYKNEAKESHTHNGQGCNLYTTCNKWFASMKRKRERVFFWMRDYIMVVMSFSVFFFSGSFHLVRPTHRFPDIRSCVPYQRVQQ